MKMLTEYSKNGFNFKVIERKGNVARVFGKKGKVENHEVIIIQSHEGREAFGKTFPPTEYPPSNNEWGSKGWTLLNEKHAIQKFKTLTE